MPGLSKDPAKRRRQLEGLAKGAEKRAATLRARLASEAEPGTAASDAPSDASSGAGGRVRQGGYSEAASGAASEAEPDAPLSDADPADLAPEPEPAGPGRGVSLAARLLGVDR